MKQTIIGVVIGFVILGLGYVAVDQYKTATQPNYKAKKMVESINKEVEQINDDLSNLRDFQIMRGKIKATEPEWKCQVGKVNPKPLIPAAPAPAK